MKMERTFFEGYGYFYHYGPKWNVKNHIGRVSSTNLGQFASYDRTGKLLGIFHSLHSATLALKAAMK